MKNLLMITTFLFLTSCASHSLMRGSVAMKVSDREAHVCMNDDEAKVGDRVMAFFNDCQKRNTVDGKSGAYGTPCVKTELGKGTVTKILNEHYSVIQFDEGVKFSEGNFVEKIK